MYGGDHSFDNGDGGRTSDGSCVYPVPRFQPDSQHPRGYRSERGVWVSDSPCGASWTSVLHPPDQFRHWCSALEAGGDCCHEDVYDDRQLGGGDW